MRRALAVAALLLAVLAGVLVVRALRFTSLQVEVAAAPPFTVDVDGAVRRLAAGLRMRTVSNQDPALLPADEFAALHRHLAASYPLAQRRLSREIVAGYSLLYTWEGRRPELPAGLLMAHQDVVPADADQWARPPFAGEVYEDEIWGRGTIDDKGALFCILEAVEALLGEGFAPERTLYLAFGHDEEVAGHAGAKRIAELLGSRGVELAWVLDEGGLVVLGAPGLERPLAVVGIAEKGSVGIGLSVEAPGGHSSTPPPHTAIGILATAIHRLERHPMPSRIGDTTRLMARYVGPELGFPARLLLANLWLFGYPLRAALVDALPPLAAMTRTTTGATIFESGFKENVLPRRAWAAVNFRILPGDTVDDVVEHVRRTIDDERIEIQVGLRSPPRNPSGVSRVDSEGFAVLQRTIGEIFPQAVVAPYLVLGGTDARHYQPLGPNVYRFNPFEYGSEALKLAHGRDERISLPNLERAVRFYRRLIQNANG